jgi:hypothetical protein
MVRAFYAAGCTAAQISTTSGFQPTTNAKLAIFK